MQSAIRDTVRLLRQHKVMLMSILYVILFVCSECYRPDIVPTIERELDSRYYVNGDPRLLAEVGVGRGMSRDAVHNEMATVAADAKQVPSVNRNADKATSTPVPKPIAAVIVPAAAQMPDGGPGPTYRENLIKGYRQALLTGAPWLILGGSEAECAAAHAYLLHLRNPATALFPDSLLEWLPSPADAVAARLKKSMEGVSTLAEWVQQGIVLKHLYWAEAQQSERAVRNVGHYIQASANGFTRYTLPALAELIVQQGIAATTGNASDAMDETEGSRHDASDDIELLHTDVDDATPPVAEQEVYDTESLVEDSHNDNVAAMMDNDGYEARQEASLRQHSDVTRVRRIDGQSFIIPAILTVPEAKTALQAQRIIETLQLVIEQVVVRQGLDAVRAAAVRSRPVATLDWWWLRRPHAVMVIASVYEQQRTRMHFLKAMRVIAANTMRTLQIAVEANIAKRAGTRQAQSGAHYMVGDAQRMVALPFDLTSHSLRRLYVVYPYNSTGLTSLVLPEPRWLPLSEAALPVGTPRSSSRVARRLGVYSHYLYHNHQRWMDALAVNVATLCRRVGHVYYFTDFVMDFAGGRIDLRDLFSDLWSE